MRRIMLIIEYDGTSYVGWQRQKNGVAVSEVIERELLKVTGEKITLTGSSRTDSGVHALAQVAHFDTNSRVPGEKFAHALNTGLPKDIRIKRSQDASADFHARFGAKQKHYRYTLELCEHASAIARNTRLHIHYPLDFEAMQKAAALFVGEHDFRAFRSTGSHVKSSVRTIFRSGWTREGDLLHYDVVGSGFLYNMVRIMVGSMLAVGKGALSPEQLSLALLSGERKLCGPTAPAHGLTLVEIIY